MKRLECWIRSDGDQTALILSPSLLSPNGSRITSWDTVGPSGHTEHDTKEDARKELTRQTGPWSGCPEFDIPASQAVYQLAETEPVWLGLTVITSGIIEQKERKAA